MPNFDNCMHCTTKRHPGCHAKCKLYKADRAEYDRCKALQEKDKEYYTYICETGMENRDAAIKRRKKISAVTKFKRNN